MEDKWKSSRAARYDVDCGVVKNCSVVVTSGRVTDCQSDTSRLVSARDSWQWYSVQPDKDSRVVWGVQYRCCWQTSIRSLHTDDLSHTSADHAQFLAARIDSMEGKCEGVDCEVWQREKLYLLICDSFLFALIIRDYIRRQLYSVSSNKTILIITK